MTKEILEGMSPAQLKQHASENGVQFNPKDGRDRLLSKLFKHHNIQVEKGYFARLKDAVKSALGTGTEQSGEPQAPTESNQPAQGGTPITDDVVRRLASVFATDQGRIRREIGDHKTLEAILADTEIDHWKRETVAETYNLQF